MKFIPKWIIQTSFLIMDTFEITKIFTWFWNTVTEETCFSTWWKMKFWKIKQSRTFSNKFWKPLNMFIPKITFYEISSRKMFWSTTKVNLSKFVILDGHHQFLIENGSKKKQVLLSICHQKVLIRKYKGLKVTSGLWEFYFMNYISTKSLLKEKQEKLFCKK